MSCNWTDDLERQLKEAPTMPGTWTDERGRQLMEAVEKGVKELGFGVLAPLEMVEEKFKKAAPTTEDEFKSFRAFLSAKGFSDEEMDGIGLTDACQCGTFRKPLGKTTRSAIAVLVGAALGIYAGVLIAYSG